LKTSDFRAKQHDMKTRLEQLIDDAHSAIQNAPVTPGTNAAEKVLECVKELARQVSRLKQPEPGTTGRLGGPDEG
jgi:hypothetical protein